MTTWVDPVNAGITVREVQGRTVWSLYVEGGHRATGIAHSPRFAAAYVEPFSALISNPQLRDVPIDLYVDNAEAAEAFTEITVQQFHNISVQRYWYGIRHTTSIVSANKLIDEAYPDTPYTGPVIGACAGTAGPAAYGVPPVGGWAWVTPEGTYNEGVLPTAHPAIMDLVALARFLIVAEGPEIEVRSPNRRVIATAHRLRKAERTPAEIADEFQMSRRLLRDLQAIRDTKDRKVAFVQVPKGSTCPLMATALRLASNVRRSELLSIDQRAHSTVRQNILTEMDSRLQQQQA